MRRLIPVLFLALSTLACSKEEASPSVEKCAGAACDCEDSAGGGAGTGGSGAYSGPYKITGRACGDGLVFYPVEACDDGNRKSGDGCSPTCQAEPGWCWDGPLFMATGRIELYECGLEPCGNGRVEGEESCDDGNATDGDGCSSTCEQEANGSCELAFDEKGPPLGVGPEYAAIAGFDYCHHNVCGDGWVGVVYPADYPDDVETCDDGNTTDGDGCNSTCKVEEGFNCDTPDPQKPSLCSAQ